MAVKKLLENYTTKMGINIDVLTSINIDNIDVIYSMA